MVSICKQVFQLGLQEHAKRRKEVDEFYACVHEAKMENKDMGIVKIEEFNRYKKRVLMVWSIRLNTPIARDARVSVLPPPPLQTRVSPFNLIANLQKN